MELGRTRYSDERLIDLVKNRENLFDRTRPDYKDENVKAATWQCIAQILNMPAEDCQNRWVRLRERFGRELRARTPGFGDAYRTAKRPWPLFNQMFWLRRFIQPRNRFSNNSMRMSCASLASATSTELNASMTNAQYDGHEQSGGSLWPPLWPAEDNSASTDAADQMANDKPPLEDDDEVLDADEQLREADLNDEGLVNSYWNANALHEHEKRTRDDALDASLAASLCSVSAALSGLARRLQDDRRCCSCSSSSGEQDEAAFGRSIATLVRNLPRNRRLEVKARILGMLATETAQAAEDASSQASIDPLSSQRSNCD